MIPRPATPLGPDAPGRSPLRRRMRPAALLGLLFVGVIAIAAWLPYIYWGLVVWRGDFSRVSIHPWLEISAVSLLLWLVARRGLDENAPAQDASTGGSPEASV